MKTSIQLKFKKKNKYFAKQLLLSVVSAESFQNFLFIFYYYLLNIYK